MNSCNGFCRPYLGLVLIDSFIFLNMLLMGQTAASYNLDRPNMGPFEAHISLKIRKMGNRLPGGQLRNSGPSRLTGEAT